MKDWFVYTLVVLIITPIAFFAGMLHMNSNQPCDMPFKEQQKCQKCLITMGVLQDASTDLQKIIDSSADSADRDSAIRVWARKRYEKRQRPH